MFSHIRWEGVLLQSIVVLLLWSTYQAVSGDVPTDSVVVKLNEDAFDHPHTIAKRNGYSYVGPINALSSSRFHHFKKGHRFRRSLEYGGGLEEDPAVQQFYELTGFTRHKRGFKNLKNEYFNYINEKNSKEKEEEEETGGLSWTTFNDPLLPKQWYLKNTGQADGRAGLDLNVESAWNKGYTGKGVTIAIMDDGIDYLHPDIADNYNAEASYDFSSDDELPYPRFTEDWFNSHGTRCAGEVSAKANNGICGVGIAYNSKVAGIRMLDQPFMTDLIEASSMSYKPQIIDIYSASWGPQDNGKTVDGPRDLTLDAIANGVNKGRGGKGSIYVWASGDGGPHDDCNCDGYASSMWTISINSAINDGRTALYDESCSSTLASTFSNGRNRNPEAGVATTDLYGNCTLSHSGTSAAAPEAAAVFALALEANRDLTWRDIQHLIVLTSKRNQLYDEEFQWQCNGVGLEFNHLFGFGVLDAGAMVTLAEDWKTVPERFHCTGAAYNGISEVPSASSGESLILKLNTDACENQEGYVRYLEHTQAIITLNSTRRGDVTIYLTSPMGTRSILLSDRMNDDDNSDGFQHWPFMTTHCWGEDPRGEWTLEVAMKPGSYARATLSEWTLVLHGTQEAPYIDGLKSQSNCVKAEDSNLYEAQNVTEAIEDGGSDIEEELEEEEEQNPLKMEDEATEIEPDVDDLLDLPIDEQEIESEEESVRGPSSVYYWDQPPSSFDLLGYYKSRFPYRLK